jgi:hypothetical protein
VSDAFLTRWSRRKLAETPPEADTPQLPEGGLEAREETLDDFATEEDIAALPPVESLDGASDIAAFLRKGVPLALRNAALRRVWAADPAIRDFIGHARDYDWDWNVVGGVPVSGPLSPGTDVAAMVRNIVGGATPQPQAPAVPTAPEPMMAHTAPARQSAAVRAMADQEPVATLPEEAESLAEEDQPQQPAGPRGHGGALPA